MTPTTPDETAAVIALLRHARTKWAQVADLVEEAGSAVTALAQLDDRRELTLLDSDAAMPTSLDGVREEVAGWTNEGMTVLTVLDDRYPENLRSVHDRPPILFIRGALEERDARSVAVVGARKASSEGLALAGKSAEALTEAGYVVVSGLADGIDGAAHRATLRAGGRTVAVVGTGLRRSYPKVNEGLQREMGERSAVVSQFWPDQPPGKHTFPLRNAVMSGFALATLVVEASRTSGARMQARLAAEHGRPVFLMRTLLIHEWAQESARRPGTYVVDSADEVIGQLDRLYSRDLSLTT